MVRCFKCGNPLPDGCTCKVSEETKVRRYFELAIREFRLCLAIMKGFKPILKVGDITLKPKEIVRRGAEFILVFPELKALDWRKCRTFILFDENGKPLYRYSRRKLWINLRRGKGISLTISLGTPSKN